MAQQILSTNTFTTAKWIVSASASDGTHTTIGGALTSASSGDTIFIRPGTYTENLTLKAGVNLTAYGSDSSLNGTGTVIISGKATFTGTGSVTISGIQLQTNSDNFLAITGSNASIVNLNNCYLNCSNNTGITFSVSNASAQLNISNCWGNLGTTGIAYLSDSSTGTTQIVNSNLANSGGSTTASTKSAGKLQIYDSQIVNPITYSSSNTASGFFNSAFDNSPNNATCLTTSGIGTVTTSNCYWASGSASAISIGSGTTVAVLSSTVNSTNTNAITGAGTITYSPIAYSGTSQTINTTTKTSVNSGTFTPTLIGQTTAGTTTYNSQTGFYTVVGNLCFIEAKIDISAATGTGNVLIGGFPFTIKNLSNYIPQGTLTLNASGWTWTGTSTQANIFGLPNTTTANIAMCKSAQAANLQQMTNAAGIFSFSMWYQIA